MEKKTHTIKARINDEDYEYIQYLAKGTERFPNDLTISQVIRQLIQYYKHH